MIDFCEQSDLEKILVKDSIDIRLAGGGDIKNGLLHLFTEFAEALKVKLQQNKKYAKTVKKEETPETLMEKSNKEEEQKEEGKN